MKYLLILTTFLMIASAHGATEEGGLKFEPLVGYETVFRDTPTPHTSTRTIYGARASYGPDWLAGELEYTKASDTEDYSVAPEKIKNEDEKLKAGAKSTYRFNEYFFSTGRLGLQANKNINSRTNAGVVTTTEKIKYDPYAGIQLGIRFGSKFSLAVGSTVVFRDINDMSKNDYQNTFSVGVGMYTK